MTFSPRAPWASRLTIAALVSAALACGPKHSATPEDLRRAWAKSLDDEDPEAAWALLSPSAQARTSKADFEARWQAQREDRAAQAKAYEALDENARAASLGGRTTHPGGRELTWIKIAGEYKVAQGLPNEAWTMTAEGTVRAFITEVRKMADARLDKLVSPELLDRVSEAWNTRADAIEAALERPGALELNAAYDRAVLRYEGGAVVLERTEAGWRILDLR